MASKITDQTYLVVTLSDATETYTRDYRIENPRADVTTVERVATALAPAFASSTSTTGTFFQDDATDAWLTKVKAVSKVELRKTETPLE